jgi:hypothetical protein
MTENQKQIVASKTKPRKTNFGKRWMNENKYLYSLGHKEMRGDHKDEMVVMSSKILWKGGIWGRGIVGG